MKRKVDELHNIREQGKKERYTLSYKLHKLSVLAIRKIWCILDEYTVEANKAYEAYNYDN